MSPRRLVPGFILFAAVLVSASGVSWREVLRQPEVWYASPEARAIADTVLLYQTPSGGWTKNHDMTVPPAPYLPGPHEEPGDTSLATIDNDATTTQILLLARVYSAQPETRYRQSLDRGLSYLLAAQYANGGWQQFYPLRPGYSTHITFNDDAMVNVMEVLQGVAAGRVPFAWTTPEVRSRAEAAFARGIACILRCQIVVNGVKTVWCAQHDEITFEPVPARAYEHESLSGAESVGIVRLLMSLDHPSPAVIAAIQGSVAWFEQSKLTGIRVVEVPDASLPHGHDRKVVADPTAPPLWARFYEIGTNRPIFGGRDTVIRYRLAEIEAERRGGYRWYVDAPAGLLERDYPAWRAKWLQKS